MSGLINATELYESKNGKMLLRVSGKELVQGVDYDRIDVSYPVDTQEVYTYKLQSVQVLRVEVNYLTNSKLDLTSVIVT